MKILDILKPFEGSFCFLNFDMAKTHFFSLTRQKHTFKPKHTFEPSL
jgi:hypothetical protein